MIGNLIKQKRIEKGITQTELAKRCHVDSKTLSRWENNEVNPRLDKLGALCKVLEIPTEVIVDELQ